MLPPKSPTFLNGLDGLWLPAVDALIKVSLVLGIAGHGDARPRPRVGRSSPSRLDAGADERARCFRFCRSRSRAGSCRLSRCRAVADASAYRATALDAVAARRARLMSERSPERGHAGPLALRAHGVGAPSESHALRSTAGAPRGRSDTAWRLPRISLTIALVAIWAAGVLAVVGRLVVGLVAVRGCRDEPCASLTRRGCRSPSSSRPSSASRAA